MRESFLLQSVLPIPWPLGQLHVEAFQVPLLLSPGFLEPASNGQQWLHRSDIAQCLKFHTGTEAPFQRPSSSGHPDMLLRGSLPSLRAQLQDCPVSGTFYPHFLDLWNLTIPHSAITLSSFHVSSSQTFADLPTSPSLVAPSSQHLHWLWSQHCLKSLKSCPSTQKHHCSSFPVGQWGAWL